MTSVTWGLSLILITLSNRSHTGTVNTTVELNYNDIKQHIYHFFFDFLTTFTFFNFIFWHKDDECSLPLYYFWTKLIRLQTVARRNKGRERRVLPAQVSPPLASEEESAGDAKRAKKWAAGDGEEPRPASSRGAERALLCSHLHRATTHCGRRLWWVRL